MERLLNFMVGRGAEVDELCQGPRESYPRQVYHGYSINEGMQAPSNDGQKPGDHPVYQPRHEYYTHGDASPEGSRNYFQPKAPQSVYPVQVSIQEASKLRLWRKQAPPNPLDKECSKVFNELLLKISCLKRETHRMGELATAAGEEYQKFSKKVERFEDEDELITRRSPRQERAPEKPKSSKGPTRLLNLLRGRSSSKTLESVDQMSSESSESPVGDTMKSPVSDIETEVDQLEERASKAEVEEERDARVSHHHSASVNDMPDSDWLQAWDEDARRQDANSRGLRRHQPETEWSGQGNFRQRYVTNDAAHGGGQRTKPWGTNLWDEPSHQRHAMYPQIHRSQHLGDLINIGRSDYGENTFSVSHKVFRQYRDLMQLVKQHSSKERQMADDFRVCSVKASEISSDIFLLHDNMRSFLVEAKLAVPKMKAPPVDPAESYNRNGSPEYLWQELELLWQNIWERNNELEDCKMRCNELIAEHRADDARMRSQMLAEKAAKEQQIERLSGLLRKLEQENAKSSQNGSYVDTAATPPLLDDHLKTVKELLLKFARVYEKTMAEAGLSIPLPNDDPENCGVVDHMHFARTTHGPRYRAAYWISTAMFRAFEIDGFDMEEGYFCPSLDLEKSHAEYYKEFQDLKSINILDILPSLQANVNRSRGMLRLLRFLRRKFETISPPEIQNCWREYSHPFLKSFVSLATAVWVLQRLAMSFEPNARIFRVKSGSQYDEQYMSNVVGEDEEEGDSVFIDKVGMMVLPGFRVGRIVIRSQVYLQALKGGGDDNS